MQRRTRIAAAFIAGLSVAALEAGAVQETQMLTFDEVDNVLTLDYFTVDRGETLTINQPRTARLLIRASGLVAIRGEVRWTGFLCIAARSGLPSVDGIMNGQRTIPAAALGRNAQVNGTRYVLLGYSDNPTDEELLSRCGG